MTNGKKLPPLPASDEKAISSNSFNSYYGERSRTFWGDNEIVRDIPDKFKDCNHYFVQKPNSAECKKCSFGLIGFFEVQKGKLYYEDKALGL